MGLDKSKLELLGVSNDYHSGFLFGQNTVMSNISFSKFLPKGAECRLLSDKEM